MNEFGLRHTVVLLFLNLPQTHSVRQSFAALRAESKAADLCIVSCVFFHIYINWAILVCSSLLKNQKKPIHALKHRYYPQRDLKKKKKTNVYIKGPNRDVSPKSTIQSTKTHLNARFKYDLTYSFMYCIIAKENIKK